jgi:hypothetical protein
LVDVRKEVLFWRKRGPTSARFCDKAAELHDRAQGQTACVTARDDGYAEADDDALLARATTLNTVLFTAKSAHEDCRYRWLREGHLPDLSVLPVSKTAQPRANPFF